MLLAKFCLLLSFIACTWGRTGVGYYLDNALNVVQVPVIELPFYLKNSSVIAVSSYYNQLNESGWTFLQINTNPSYSDYLQMYAAGFLEGTATYDIIWDAWNNFNEFTLYNASTLPGEAQEFITNQTKWILETAQNNTGDHYWDLVNATFGQLKGMYDGYIAKIGTSGRDDMYLSFDQFYYLTNMGDLEDIIPAYNISFPQYMECSALFKLTQDDLIVAHTTFNLYSLMLRVFKSYHIPLNNPLVRVNTMMLSSRPGDLESKDDFYVLDSELVVVETSLNNYNLALYANFHYDSLPCWLRCLLANRIASTGEEWADVFYTDRSGTHNNQWLVLDYKKYDTYKNNLSTAEGIIWIVEEFYNLESAHDITQELLIPNGYVAGFNVPYNQTIYEESNYTSGYHYNYTTDPRSILFKEYVSTVTDMKSAQHLIRYNNVSDTGSVCSAISPRCDLLSEDPFIFGAIDGKVTNRELTRNMLASVISGPTTENHPAFSWDKWPDAAKRGMPTTFNFDWVLVQATLGPLPHDHDENIITI